VLAGSGSISGDCAGGLDMVVLLCSLSFTIYPYDGSWLRTSTLYTVNLERSVGISTSDKPETDELAFRTFISLIGAHHHLADVVMWG